MKAYISELVNQAVHNLSPNEAEQVFGSGVFDVTYPKPGFGDYATNAAMVLFKKFNDAPATNSAEFAQKLSAEITKLDQKNSFAKVEPVGGFINFTLTKEALAHAIESLSQKVEIEPVGAGKKVVFEYSSPNTNKPLHIGHTRNDTFGKACINLLRATGHEVISCEIINDRGIHIMKSVLMYQKYGEGQTPNKAGIKPDHFVGKFYAMFGQKAAESETTEAELLEEAQELLRRWEDGNEEIRTVWQQMNEWFFEGVKETYNREGSDFDEQDFESQIYDKGRDLVLSGVEKGIFQKEADGSVSINLENEGLDKKYLLRKDGTTLYVTQDIYLWDQRNKKHQPDIAIVTTSAEQSYHFAVLAKIFTKLGYAWAPNFKHLPYEHVYLGKSKMSSRAGNAVTADQLVEDVKEKVRQTMAGLERLKGSVDDDELVEKVAFGAIKFGYLNYEPQTRIYFDIDETIALQGKTGPYIQYAFARIQSILSKTGRNYQAPVELDKPEELSLMRLLLQYSDTVVTATRDYKPNLLCNYLFEVASSLNAFYASVSVTQEPDENIKAQRIGLLIATANVLEHGLGLLGIAAPEEM